MSGTLINKYANDNSNILAVQDTLDKTFFAKIDSISLTNYNNSTIPQIAAGSVVSNNGALYEFTSNESISTTDPVTSSTVADGWVFVCLIPNLGSGTITAAFTATAPTWSDSKQGWYLTGAYANYRVINYTVLKSTSSYTFKIQFQQGITRFTPFVFTQFFDNSSIDTKSAVNLTSSNQIDPLNECGSSSIVLDSGGFYDITLSMRLQASNMTPTVTQGSITLEVNGSNIGGTNCTFTPAESTGTGAGAIYASGALQKTFFLNAGDAISVETTLYDQTTYNITGDIMIRRMAF